MRRGRGRRQKKRRREATFIFRWNCSAEEEVEDGARGVFDDEHILAIVHSKRKQHRRRKSSKCSGSSETMRQRKSQTIHARTCKVALLPEHRGP